MAADKFVILNENISIGTLVQYLTDFISILYCVNQHPRVIQVRVSFSFLPKGEGGQKEIVWIIGGHAHICVQACGKLGGFGGLLPRGNFDFGPFIRRNLVESGTVFAQTIYHLLCH